MQIIKILNQHGFIFVSQKGSHAKFRKVDGETVSTVIVPTPRKDIPHGTFRSIVRQSKLSFEDFDY